MNNSKNTLLYVYISTHFKEIIRVARVMKKSGIYVPYVFFVSPYEGWERDSKLCQNEGIHYVTYFDRVNQSVKPVRSRLERSLELALFKAKISNKIYKYVLISLLSLMSLLGRISRRVTWSFFKLIKALCELPAKILKLTRQWVTYCTSQCKKNCKNFWIKLKHKTHPLIRFFIPVLDRRAWARLLLSAYRLIWNKAPHLLPATSRAAHSFFYHIPIVLKEHNIELIVFPEHNLFYFTQITTMIGRSHDIPSVIVPFTIANTIEWSEAFYDEPSRSLKSNYNKICAYAFPRWIHTYKNRKLLLPVDLILLHEMFQIAPKNPWLLNSGDIDFLASESEAMNHYYIAAGIEKKHLRTVGALYNDELYLKSKNAESSRIALYQSLQMDLAKPMILCALPPNQCVGRESVIEFGNYEEIVRFIVSELSKYADKFNIIINLHPRIVPASVDYIKTYPVKIFTGDIAEIVSLSSIYVASCSATIRMAISCGIPVVNYDLYHYHYNDYVALDAVLTSLTREEYSQTLNKLAQNDYFYNKIKEIQIKQGSQWGALDGKAGDNLLTQINKLFENKRAIDPNIVNVDVEKNESNQYCNS